DWLNNGYIDESATGLKAEDALVRFLSGDAAMIYDGTWDEGRINEDANFEWSSFPLPDVNLTPGNSGNLWVVPDRSENKDLSYKFIDMMLSEDAQVDFANDGGVAFNATEEEIDDPRNATLIGDFNNILDDGGIAYYPGGVTPQFYDQL